MAAVNPDCFSWGLPRGGDNGTALTDSTDLRGLAEGAPAGAGAHECALIRRKLPQVRKTRRKDRCERNSI